MERLTNTGFNTQAQVIDQIRSQEQVHWFWGLRQAEEFIRDRSMALEQNQFDRRKIQRQIQLLEINKEEHKGRLLGAQDPDRNRRTFLEIEGIDDEIAQLRQAEIHLNPMIRDCEMELATAQQERDRIATQYAIENFSYEELQAAISEEALFCKQIKFVAGRVFAARQGLPESVGEMLMMMPSERRDKLIEQTVEQLNGASDRLVLEEVTRSLAPLESSLRQQVMVQAIQLVKQQQHRRLEASYEQGQN